MHIYIYIYIIYILYIYYLLKFIYFGNDKLEKDLIKSSKITNNRNGILSTSQPEQSGAERYNIFSFTVFLSHMRVDE